MRFEFLNIDFAAYLLK